MAFIVCLPAETTKNAIRCVGLGALCGRAMIGPPPTVDVQVWRRQDGPRP
jgi:predicted RNA-binding protein